MTTIAAAKAAVAGIRALKAHPADVMSLQEYHTELRARTGTEG
jgi:hypothetical protein